MRSQIVAKTIIKQLKAQRNKMNIELPRYGTDQTKKIAIIQPGSWGDNINSTIMLKPIRNKWSNCIIDVYTSTTYASAFHNNNLINKVYEINSNSKQEALHLLTTIPPNLAGCGYDIIFNPHPMINPDKWTSIKHGQLNTNLICAWVRALEDADIEYNLPLESILTLTQQEINKVDEFCKNIDMSRRKNIMEVQGESGQTFWDANWTKSVVDKLCSAGEIVFISNKNNVPELTNKYPGLCVGAHTLSIRECAELFNRCDRFFSVSSGLSNACNTNWCRKDTEWVEVINSEVVSSAPIRSTNKRFWYDPNLDNFLKTI